MAVWEPILKYIHDLDSPYKLAGFVAIVFFAGAGALAKKKNILTKTGFIVLISILGLITCVAILASAVVKRTYTLSVTLRNESRVPYTFDQADVKTNVKAAIKDYSSTSDSWTFVFEPDELPSDRSVILSAKTLDSKFIVDTLIKLTEEKIQAIALVLSKDTNVPAPPPPTYSINLTDKTVRRDIESNGYIYNPASSRNRITVTYDPSQIVQEHYTKCYTFNRSSPVVTIDGVRFPLENCYIPDYEGRTLERQTVEKYASEQSSIAATAFFRQNPHLLASWLRSSGH